MTEAAARRVMLNPNLAKGFKDRNQWKSNTKTPSRTLVAAAIRLEHAVVPKKG